MEPEFPFQKVWLPVLLQELIHPLSCRILSTYLRSDPVLSEQAAIHVTPEASKGGVLSRLQDGDVIEIDARQDLFHLHLTQEQLALRSNAHAPRHHALGYGLELFAAQRRWVGPADQGASFLIED